MSNIVRFGGLGLCVAAAIGVFFLLAPNVSHSTATLPANTDYQSLLATVLADDAANNLRTTGAPQQTVVNGWAARDLLTIIAKENIDILTSQGAIVDATGTLQTAPFDDRVPALILIGIVAFFWEVVTRPRVVGPLPAMPLLEPPASGNPAAS